ncbi:MAG: hypothetical protein V4620_07005, partial [Bacteroidota bacterium]
MNKHVHLLLILFLLAIASKISAQPTFYTGNINAPSNSFPFNWGTAGKSMQSLVAPGELTGAYIGRITTLYFQGTASNTSNFTGVTINMGQTAATTLPASSIVTGLTNVYTAATLTASSDAAGWMSITLQTPFVYDPAQSLVIEITICSTNSGAFTVTNVSKSGFRRTWNVSGCTMAYSGQDANLFNFGVDMIPGVGANNLLPPIANFYTPDTVWINSPQTILNTSSFQSRVFWNLPDENPLYPGYNRTTSGVYAGYIDTAKYKNHFTYTFTSPGLKRVKLLAVNDYKRDSLLDSIVKYIYVDTPSQKPKADFISFKRKLGFSEEAPLLDLSTNGPNQWEWSFDPPCATCATDPNAFPNYFN